LAAGFAGSFRGILNSSRVRSEAARAGLFVSISTMPVRNAAAMIIKAEYGRNDFGKSPGLEILRCGGQHTNG
jgi:hypothetical protein